MKLHAVCIGSYLPHEPKVCDCLISLVLAENITQAQIKGRRMCEERYSYLKGWDEAGSVDVATLEQGMQVEQYVLNYSMTKDVIEPNDKSVNSVTPSIYATGVASHYWWGQDEYPECFLSFTIATDVLEAEKFGEKTKNKLFAMADGKWADSYAVTAVRLEDVTQVENYHIQWSIQKLEN